MRVPVSHLKFARELVRALEGRKITGIKLIRSTPGFCYSLKDSEELYEFAESADWIDNIPDSFPDEM